jgi:hypothetical protein
MNFRPCSRNCGALLLALAVVCGSASVVGAAQHERPVIAGPILNLDSTQFFFEHSAGQMSGETVDAYIDLLAEAGIRTFFTCVNAQKANYASKIWEPDWSGYDPRAGDDQPVLRHIPPGAIPATRQRLESAKRLADLGINLHERFLRRCRQRGLGAWVSVRLNDVHDCLLEDSSLLSAFYKGQRAAGQLRATHRPGTWWADRGLDWERPEVQEHYFKLVLEQLETLDLDGLELDWMRFVYHFRPGRELAGGQAVTAWMRRVRAACERAAVRLGHPVMLGVRVPTRPETARRNGLDAVAWAREGLVDLVVPTPFWTTTDFDVPVVEWKRLLQGTGARLAPGIELRYQPVPNGPALMMSPELTAGAALPLLHGGADLVYLFNYDPLPMLRMKAPGGGPLWTMDSFNRMGRALQSAGSLAAEPRLHAVTYHDVRAPGEPADNALPAVDSGEDFPWPPGCAVRIVTGPKPVDRAVELRLEFAASTVAPEQVRIFVNSTECQPVAGVTGLNRRYTVPGPVLQEEAQVVEIVTPPGVPPFKLVRVELFVAGAMR